MKLAFLGTSDFAVPALSALVEAGHEVAVVYTRAPKPARRGPRERRTPVHERALSLGLAARMFCRCQFHPSGPFRDRAPAGAVSRCQR